MEDSTNNPLDSNALEVPHISNTLAPPSPSAISSTAVSSASNSTHDLSLPAGISTPSSTVPGPPTPNRGVSPSSARSSLDTTRPNLSHTHSHGGNSGTTPTHSHSRNPSLRLSGAMGSNHQHRQSFSESLRGLPPSPRAQRQLSLTQAALQELINHPPAQKGADPAFQGRDWRQIAVSELVSPEDLRFVENDTGVEAATNLLIDSGAPVLLIREHSTNPSAIGTFDYADLNAYLLLVVGLAQPDEEHITSLLELAKKAREGSKIPIKDVKDLGRKDPLVTLPHTADLRRAVEVFGSGIHRVIIVKEGTDEVTGILSQWRLVKFLWENGRGFPVIDQLYPQSLRTLKVGSNEVMCINGDAPLFSALELMNNEGISSLAVVDNQHNVVGNISTVDVKLLTKSSSLPLLRSSCIHFISVILSTRGMNEGKDSFPVFYVNPQSTLAHTVAKLVATKAHRLWITDPQSPMSSGPPTPSHHTTVYPPPHPSSASGNNSQSGSSPFVPNAHQPPSYSAPHHPGPIPPPSLASPTTASAPTSSITPPATPIPSAIPYSSNPGGPIIPSIPASALPGAHLSGHLVGVASLTDILNLYARASGLSPGDPAETRRNRRRSSSSSLQSQSGFGSGSGMGGVAGPRRSGELGSR